LAELARILFLFVYALVLAALEIEIEGRYGWAERLPTWYRTRGPWARAYGCVMAGKPLTGYHAMMFLFALLSFHLRFVDGARFGLADEARTLARFLVWAVVWDFLWFLWNPAYGWARFRRGAIWWHNARWIGRFPIDYYRATAASLALACAAAWAEGLPALFGHLRFCAGMCLLVLLAAAIAPRYRTWHIRMHAPERDDRARANVFHEPPG
jgi:hypothetical protein